MHENGLDVIEKEYKKDRQRIEELEWALLSLLPHVGSGAEAAAAQYGALAVLMAGGNVKVDTTDEQL